MPPQVLEKKLKNEKNFIPSLLVFKNSCKRKANEKRSETMNRSAECTRIRRKCTEKEDDSMQEKVVKS